jgi:hypothetical protein
MTISVAVASGTQSIDFLSSFIITYNRDVMMTSYNAMIALASFQPGELGGERRQISRRGVERKVRKLQEATKEVHGGHGTV